MSRRIKKCPATFTSTPATEKGKTTAALGLAIRPPAPVERLFRPVRQRHGHQRAGRPGTLPDRITVRQYGQPSFIRHGPDDEDVDLAGAACSECREAIASGRYRLVILDEANLGPTLQLFPVEVLLELIDARPDGVELVLTGREPTAACWTGPIW